MSKEQHLTPDNRPVIFIALDLDDTLYNTEETDKLAGDNVWFNGADGPNDPGPWGTAIEELKNEYKESVNLQFRILTSRPEHDRNSFSAAKYLKLNNIDKSTGIALSDKEQKEQIEYYAYHTAEIYVVDDQNRLKDKVPSGSFIWDAKNSKLYWISNNKSKYPIAVNEQRKLRIKELLKNKHENISPQNKFQSPEILHDLFEEFAYSTPRTDQKKAESKKWKQFTQVEAFITTSGQSDIRNYEQSSIVPATHLSPRLPKARVMERFREEPWIGAKKLCVMASILVDDCDHTKYFTNKDTWIDAKKIKANKKNSLEVKAETLKVLENLKKTVKHVVENPLFLLSTRDQAKQIQLNITAVTLEIDKLLKVVGSNNPEDLNKLKTEMRDLEINLSKEQNKFESELPETKCPLSKVNLIQKYRDVFDSYLKIIPKHIDLAVKYYSEKCTPSQKIKFIEEHNSVERASHLQKLSGPEQTEYKFLAGTLSYQKELKNDRFHSGWDFFRPINRCKTTKNSTLEKLIKCVSGEGKEIEFSEAEVLSTLNGRLKDQVDILRKNDRLPQQFKDAVFDAAEISGLFM